MTTVPVPDFAEILTMFRKNADQRRSGLAAWEAAIKTAADAESDYSRAYAEAIVRAEGNNQATRDAHARAATVEQRARRDVARDMKDVCKERVRGLEGERANINALARWAQSLEPGLGG